LEQHYELLLSHCRAQHLQEALQLLRDVSFTGKQLDDALAQACLHRGTLELVQALVYKGADPTSDDSIAYRYALHTCEEITIWLLQNNPHIRVENWFDEAALGSARFLEAHMAHPRFAHAVISPEKVEEAMIHAAYRKDLPLLKVISAAFQSRNPAPPAGWQNRVLAQFLSVGRVFVDSRRPARKLCAVPTYLL
jgi:hypothetical protein